MSNVTVTAPLMSGVGTALPPPLTVPLMSARATMPTPTVLANVTVFLVDGFGYTGFLRFTKIAQSLGAAPNKFVQVQYNNQQGDNLPNIVAGVATFDQLVNSPQYAGPKIAIGISMGTQLLYKWIRDKSATASSYAQPSQLSFVLLANPENKYTGCVQSTSAFGSGYGGAGIPDSCPYTVQNFVRQFDGVGDYPNLPNPSSTALTNAWLGMACLHNNYFYVGLSDRTNFSHVEGPTSNLTYTWNQTYPAPIVGGMQDIWQFFNANPVPVVGDPVQGGDKTNRPIIESAYSRPVQIQTPTPSMVLPTPVAAGAMLTPAVVP